nr:hypothetical protein [Bacteroidales bacterium]
MKRLILLGSILFLSVVNSFSQVLFSEYFESAYSSHFFMAYGTSNAGNDYTCSPNNRVGLMNSSSDEYLTTKAINVAPGYGVKISFNLRKATGYSTSNIKVYFVVNKETTFNWNNPTYNAWTEVKSFSASASNTSCTLNTINLPAEVVGGQRLSITIQFKSASSSSWVAIDDLIIEQSNYTTPTNSYSENFNSGKWYPDGSIAVPYHSYVTASNGYTYLFNYGKDGYSDYYAAFYTGGDYVEGGQTNFITKEINTSNYQNGELRYMWRSQYPCGGPN